MSQKSETKAWLYPRPSLSHKSESTHLPRSPNQEQERRYISVKLEARSKLPAIEDIERVFSEHEWLLELPRLEEHFYRLAIPVEQGQNPDQGASESVGDHEGARELARGMRVSVLMSPKVVAYSRSCSNLLSCGSRLFACA